MNESYVFYKSFADAIEDLPAEQYKSVMIALNRYALEGELPETADVIVKALLTLMIPQIDANNKRREAGSKGGKQTQASAKQTQASAKQTQASAKQTQANVNDNVNDNANANVNVNDNVNDNANANEQEKDNANALSKKKTMPPTIEDVRAYCAERCNGVDAERFVDYYSANGWKVGKNPMKDWKAAVRTWEGNVEYHRSEIRGKPVEQMSKDEFMEMWGNA